jgi:hypothetical protein
MTSSVHISEQDTEQATWVSTALSVVQIIGFFAILFGRSWNPHLFWGLHLVWGAVAMAKLYIHESYGLFPKTRIVNRLAGVAGVGLFLIGLAKLAEL